MLSQFSSARIHEDNMDLFRPMRTIRVALDEKQITEYVKWQSHQDSGQAKLDLQSATGYARGYLHAIT